MKISRAKKLNPMERFLYWITERYSIYLRKENGESKPWTDDTILQSCYFTNAYREHDKTTVWFRENVRDPTRDMLEVLMATVIFRWFNKIETGELLLHNKLLTSWNEAKATRLIRELNKVQPVFTSAFMVKAGNGPPGCKVPNVCKAITAVWKERHRLLRVCEEDCRLQALWAELCKFNHLGGFMSYEVVCDLRYTGLLDKAIDINTWTNLGPGAARGLQRIQGLPIKIARTGVKDTRPKPPNDWLGRLIYLRRVINRKLKGKVPRFELREVEHSLCELDKYERVLFGQGRSKRKYNGTGE